jgi:sugar transferase (PEP-CTERM/EpsH1 system associated)
MQVIYSFGLGGSETVARDIALNMKNYTVHSVAALESDGPLQKILNAAGVRTFLINKRPFERISPILRLWSAMREFRPDVVHTHHLYELFYAWPGALLCGAGIIHTEHEYYSLISHKVRLRLRLLSRLCRAVTGVNEETSSFLREEIGISPKKVHTIVNGIDLKRFATCKPDRKALGFAEDDRVVGVVARLVPVKDHATLLQAFHMVAARLPLTKLLIIGDGPERPGLESMVENLGLHGVVRFLGARHDVPELIASLDVAVLSSKEEGLPLCILEALASGKPVVATRVGGIPSVVLKGETGILVPAGDPEALSSALLSMLSDADHAKQLGQNGRKLVERRYDLQKSLNDYYSLYKKL